VARLFAARRIPGGTISYKGHQFGPRSSLWLRDMQSGAERMIVDPIEQDLAEGASGKSRQLPGYSWSTDSRWLVFSQGGKLRKVDVATGEISTIAFTARVHRVISQQANHKFRITDEPFTARYLRGATASPDGGRLLFQAVGKIWVQDLPQGAARRLTPDSLVPSEYGASWSPDGNWIAFTSWDDEAGGRLWRIPAGGGEPQSLTDVPGEYMNPVWSADGRSLTLVRGSGATLRGRAMADNEWWDIVRLDIGSRKLTDIGRIASPRMGAAPQNQKDVARPAIGADGQIHYEIRKDVEGKVELISLDPATGSKKVTAVYTPQSTRNGMTDDMQRSPDGRWVAYTEYGNVFIAPLDRSKKQPVALTPAMATQISRTGGLDPRWRDKDTIEFVSADGYFQYHLADKRLEKTTLHLEVPRDIPTGSVALRNARIITLARPGVIQRGTIVVRGSRIACVGKCDVRGVDKVVDVKGKSIVPGYIDMHGHRYGEYLGVIPSKGADSAVYLAYGVTTLMDPAADSKEIFTTRELIDAGRVIGPRTFSTGDTMDGSNPILVDYATVLATEEKLRSWGATAAKQYAQPRRAQRQWTTEAARQLGLNVTSEGMDLYTEMGLIMDGQTGVEHMLANMPIYSDVARFFGAANFCYSPTFQGSGAGPWNGQYWVARTPLWADRRQQEWVPWRKLWPAARRPVLRPYTDYSFPMAAQGMADIIAAGGCGVIGGHDLQPGLASHWDIWASATAMSNYDALSVASLQGARFLGAEQDLGSLEVGKLADLVILNSNPLDHIESTADIHGVMKGGVLYDSHLNETWPRMRPFGDPT
jgi:hypothetical protein